MALAYANMKVIHPGPQSSAVAFLAYMKRARLVDEVTGQAYDFTEQHEGGEDLLADGVELPEGAPETWRDPARLVNDMQRAELVRDRKTGEVRYRSGAQLARAETLAMPRELGLEEWKAMVTAYVQETYVSKGVPVAWAIHDASGDQPHAHLLVSTRAFDPATGKLSRRKARELNPDFAKGVLVRDEPGLRWAAFQEQWARSRGLELSFDLRGPVPQMRRGKGRFIDGPSDAMGQADEAEEANREALRDPAKVLATLAAQKSTWTKRDLGRLLQALPLQERDEIKDLVLAQDEVVKLDEDVYTTRSVVAQEQRLVALAERWGGTERHAASAEAVEAVLATQETLSEEQRATVLDCVASGQLALVRGGAGTGKSHSMKVVRDCYQLAGSRVVGMAPTNTVAQDMVKDGFKDAGTLHRHLFCQENEIDPAWNANTVLIVDEAGMVDTDMMDRLFRRADATGAKVILVGDERQLSSVQRGGMYAELRRRFGGSEITAVRRQNADWQRQASVALSEGRMKEAVEAYAANGCVLAGKDEDATRKLLLRDWAAAYEAAPEKQRFIFTLSNKDSARLNVDIQEALERAGRVHEALAYKTERGEFRAGIGDRIQFHANKREAGYFNGHIGTITARGEDGRLWVDLDTGARVSFDPEKESRWGLGYAGTVHRGQGKTLPEAFYLHNPYGDSRVAYVGGTRHRENLRIYYSQDRTVGLGMLAQQMGRRREERVAVSYLDRDKTGEAPATLIRDVDHRQVDERARSVDGPGL